MTLSDPVAEARRLQASTDELGRALLKGGLATKSVRNMLGFLHGVFEHAIDRGWVSANPVRRAEKSTRTRSGPNPDIQFLSVSELEAVTGQPG
jgi:hypothetical protein